MTHLSDPQAASAVAWFYAPAHVVAAMDDRGVQNEALLERWRRRVVHRVLRRVGIAA